MPRKKKNLGGRPATVNAPNRVNLRMSDPDIKAIERAARRLQVTFSEVIRIAVANYLRKGQETSGASLDQD